MKHRRSAGLLLHITSLPSAFGVGDLGPEAYKFVDFLTRANQRYWQVLPLSPVSVAEGFSPYSATSAMAGNTLMISPEQLAADGLLSASELKRFRIEPKHTADFAHAEASRDTLLELAWKRSGKRDRRPFEAFANHESWWLDDFAAYAVLKESFEGKPWHRWPAEFQNRDKKALAQLQADATEKIAKVKWLQFVFAKQWSQLREHCRKQGIRLLGDLPFYTSYDSADVWSTRKIFAIRSDGAMTSVAGVPPDYFNNNGQLWGMPVFRWNILRRQGYKWWINRLRRNLELFDEVRLDHFRAFAGYWEVPATEKTAKHGGWKKGPGIDLFEKLKHEFPNMPFVAEDLGEITPDVYELRDRYALPGMKVLQFAFGGEVATSGHIPHNYDENFFVYTGTHDNNTTVGWFKKEASPTAQKQLEAYAGIKVTTRNVHLILLRLAYASVAKTVIIPLQDILGLDDKSRMNIPASPRGNWQFRTSPGSINKDVEKYLRRMTYVYGRG